MTTIAEIQATAAAVFGVPVLDITSRRQDRRTSRARFAAMYAARRRTSASLSTIGQHFGGRDHSTVLYALGRAQDLSAHNLDYADRVAELLERVG